MQFIKQTLKLIIIDKLVHLFLHRLQRIYLWRPHVLSLTMKLVQQGLKLIIGDIARATRYRGCCSRLGRSPTHAVELVQQTFKFVCRNFIDRAAAIDRSRLAADGCGFNNFWSNFFNNYRCCRFRFYSRSRTSSSAQLLFPFRLAQLVEVMKQII